MWSLTHPSYHPARRWVILLLILTWITNSFSASADGVNTHFLVYSLGGRLEMVFLGRAIESTNSRAVRFVHPKYGTLIFNKQLAEVFPISDPTIEWKQQMKEAAAEKDYDELLAIARKALKKGYLNAFYSATKFILAENPDHEIANIIRKVKIALDQPGEVNPEDERDLRERVDRSGMAIKRSAHFIVLHDLGDKPEERGEQPLIDQRLELMEKVYESFFAYFASHGVELEPLKAQVKVVIFREASDFRSFAEALSPTLPRANGFWNAETNISFFYEQSTDEIFQALTMLAEKFKDLSKDLKRERVEGRAEIIRFAESFDVLIKVARESQNIEVLSHELTHQLAGTTSLLPRNRPIPTWVHEGLATYFEAPKDASWSGIGAVNEGRLDLYRVLASDQEHSNLKFVVSNQIFSRAASDAALVHGYGQAWALTHYLMERHFDRLIKFYRSLDTLPPGYESQDPETYQKLFEAAFPPSEFKDLEAKWRTYMSGLRTDLEAVTGRKR